MKATIFSLGMLLAVCSVNAQNQNPFQLGVKVASNHANIAGNLENLSKSSAMGFSAGVTAKYHMDRFFVQTELLYSESKSSLDNPLIDRAKWKSIDLPVSIGYTLFDFNTIRLHVLAGGVYSRVINDKLSAIDNLTTGDWNFNKNNVKAQVGAGVTMGRFAVELTYARQLNSLSKNFKSKSNQVQLGVSYMFL
ncbi:hypothetical protein M2306_001419 [Myroides gitamensis]|uniref:porin family protein n=1 Tax=Myroides odoratus TaxID=256 RepID=UPI00216A5E03|nr:porin family protein [Myroides odoratus]MCS4238463.1 hypothetical protein [Myroides odoratus]MDH6600725.1 hypothetical protein [Myroides gitamensis]